MKRTLLVAALAAITSLTLAQSPGSPPHRGSHGGPHGGPPPIERLAQDLSLTADQQPRVQAIFEAQHSRMEAERANSQASGMRPSREEMHARMEQRDAELRAQLATVLTPEQLVKFDSLRKRQHRMGPPPVEAAPVAGVKEE
jgi:Spy/CpxP family protein refolding chaperone